MKIALKPTEIRLARTEGEDPEEFYFLMFQMIAMKKKDLQKFIERMNEENEVILELK